VASCDGAIELPPSLSPLESQTVRELVVRLFDRSRDGTGCLTRLVPADDPSSIQASKVSAIDLRTPRVSDAVAVHRLVVDSGVLDVNSLYCYLLFCRDFADTCVVAELDGQLVGFATAYCPPQRPEALFVWQIAIAPAARRRGLGLRMLQHLLSLPGSSKVQFLEATVTPSNGPSRRLFHKLAEQLNVECQISSGFSSEAFGSGDHEAEDLFRIGPL
jgi:L-2,4-diaminobutyric acid acetyltransferase